MDWNVGVYWMSLPFPRKCLLDSAPRDVLSFTSTLALCMKIPRGGDFSQGVQTLPVLLLSLPTAAQTLPRHSGHVRLYWAREPCPLLDDRHWTNVLNLSDDGHTFCETEESCKVAVEQSQKKTTLPPFLVTSENTHWALVPSKFTSPHPQRAYPSHAPVSFCKRRNQALKLLEREVGGTFLLHWGFASEDWRGPGEGTQGFWLESQGGMARPGWGWGGEACIDRGGDENRPHHLSSRAAAISRTWFLTGHRDTRPGTSLTCFCSYLPFFKWSHKAMFTKVLCKGSNWKREATVMVVLQVMWRCF